MSFSAPSLPRRVPRRSWLVNGDCLRQPEFHRRYLAMPEVKRAELVEGIVYMASPVRISAHAAPHFMIVTWLGSYAAYTPHVSGGDNGSVLLDLDNEVQPDAFLRWTLDGKSELNDEDYIVGAPELVFEIASSSVNYDLHQKKEAYRRNGVQEYAVWRVEEGGIDWWELVDGEYIPLAREGDGLVRSVIFPGLVLDTAAALSGNNAGVMQAQSAALAGKGAPP